MSFTLRDLAWTPVVAVEVRSTAEPWTPTPVFPRNHLTLRRLQAFEGSLGRFAERSGDPADTEFHTPEDP